MAAVADEPTPRRGLLSATARARPMTTDRPPKATIQITLLVIAVWKMGSDSRVW